MKFDKEYPDPQKYNISSGLDYGSECFTLALQYLSKYMHDSVSLYKRDPKLVRRAIDLLEQYLQEVHE